MLQYGKLREEFVLQPVSGRAVPIQAGEVLRIVQEVGGQCVDFNCFNLHDYKEYMSVGMMRRSGFRTERGDYIISNPPRSGLMMLILELPETCVTDLLALRCSADYFEATWGFNIHTNCQDTLAEAIREYGLTPDDTHDSFNMWMNTGWDDRGRWEIRRNTGQGGDYVDLLALMDVLAVPVICGSGDMGATGNFFLRPIRIQVFKSSHEIDVVVRKHLEGFGRYKNQRSIDNLAVREIRRERELEPDPSYEPHFVNYPLGMKEIEVELTEEDQRLIEWMKERGLCDDEEDGIRSAVLGWYLRNRSEPSPFGPRLS